MIRIACFPEELILPIIFPIDARDLNHICCTVALSRLMPTQSELIPAILDHYRNRRRMTDADNALPYGIQFAGSDTVFITNGHHRWYVCREQGRHRLRMWVHHHPLTIRDALVATFCQPPPKPPATVHRTRQITPAPRVRVRPLPLPVF